ncbi:MAG: type III-A CRISPR-associated protein Cas10/Csm1, partial [Thermoflexus sp.]
MEEAVYRIALAGLLHPIGPFAQWAGWKKGRGTEVVQEFVRQFVPSAWREGDRLLPDDPTKIVALADRLSAGRPTAEDEGQRPSQLRSIFCALTADGQKAPSPRYWPLRPLRMQEDALFPREAEDPLEIEKAYQDLWARFAQEAQALAEAHSRGGQLPVYLESMLLLLQRYAWCVPSAHHRALPDVSLYDHSRTVAALAVCLWRPADEAAVDRALDALGRWHREREQNPSAPMPAELEAMEVALLVGGDISGVQDFIYTITARGATSALRGRSFYLQLLTEAVARYVLRRLELPITNLLYQGGGGFYLLARPSDRARLEEVRREVSRILLTHHQGDLYLAMEAVPLAAADFYDGRISGKWRELGERLQKARQRRFTELGDELGERLFKPQGHGGNEERECQVCGREHPGTKEEDGVRKCPPCRSYEALGDDLRLARYLWLMEVEPEGGGGGAPGGWKEDLRAFGLQAGVAKDPTGVPDAGRPRWILAVTDEALDSLRPDARTVIGRRFLVNVTPVWKDQDEGWL